MTIDTDWIAGYADGTLDPERRRLVEAALARDPDLAATLRHEREMAALLAAAYPAVEEPLPPALARLLAPRPAAMPQVPRRRPAARWLGAIAAAVALLAVIGGGWTALRVIDSLEDRVARIETAEQVRLAAQQAIDTRRAEVLEQAPNGIETPWRDGASTGRVRPVSTFIDASGRFCREFVEAIEGPDGPRNGGGIACRVGQGDWRIWWPDGKDSGQAL
ncbi:RT0821/Lpp0805 family surface protein [Inquilinus sp. OTU3971]|uniref:RT0821/Lpp0805 family surface protein n=1 Tax=Inquilinus sp. OTU3971 TaxID=3043855 RepID=UPI00313AAC7D